MQPSTHRIFIAAEAGIHSVCIRLDSTLKRTVKVVREIDRLGPCPTIPIAPPYCRDTHEQHSHQQAVLHGSMTCPGYMQTCMCMHPHAHADMHVLLRQIHSLTDVLALLSTKVHPVMLTSLGPSKKLRAPPAPRPAPLFRLSAVLFCGHTSIAHNACMHTHAPR